MTKCFSHGQRIRHNIGIKSWIGIYNSLQNGIIHEDVFYKSLSGFVNSHHRQNGTYKNNGVNGWACTYCEVDGNWISTYNLKR